MDADYYERLANELRAWSMQMDQLPGADWDCWTLAAFWLVNHSGWSPRQPGMPDGGTADRRLSDALAELGRVAASMGARASDAVVPWIRARLEKAFDLRSALERIANWPGLQAGIDAMPPAARNAALLGIVAFAREALKDAG